MNRWIIGLAAGMIVASLSQADAKTINMGVISRSDISIACQRAGGDVFGVADLSRSYGCSTVVSSVYCTVDHVCTADIGDTLPMTGNSLDYVLTYGRPAAAAFMIRPLNSRIEPLKQPQH